MISCSAELEDSVGDFLGMLSQFVKAEAANREVKLRTVGSNEVGGTDVCWTRRILSRVYPLYMESFNVDSNVAEQNGNDTPITEGFPGQWIVDGSIFEERNPRYFRKCETAWKAWVKQGIESQHRVGGLSFNVLDIPTESLKNGDVDVRPLTMHAISADGRGVDRGNPEAQAALANAFWQTFWATGATRTERGSVFPVAFLPIDRSNKYEFAEPFHERYVTLRRRFFGRSAIVNYVLEVLTKYKALLFDSADCRFKIASDFDPSAHEVSSADILLAISELNRTGFIDSYTGANRSRFSDWTDQETKLQAGEPWPYTDESWNQKIKAAGHGNSDYLEAVRTGAHQTDTTAVIHRVVPFAGCAYLSQVMSDLDGLKESGKVQDFDGELIGATNSTFFLNFPEEYCALHSAMNEPVALLVENGNTRQIRTLKRATFVLSEAGEAMITTRASNRLNSEVLVFEGESLSATYFNKSDMSFRKNTFGPLFFGAAVVGNSIVETFEESASEVPPAGWMIGDSEAFGGRIRPENAAEAQVRVPGNLKEVAIRHAFAIGPLLLQDGKVVPLQESREDFASIQLNHAMTFQETSVLNRTSLPGALLDCDARGVPPTRFPYDWNVTRAPRSAIGIKADGSVIVAVVDGRADVSHSVGATLAELAEIMKSIGCVDAMNMDGGGSSVMFVNSEDAVSAKLRDDLKGGIVNLPSDQGGVERLLPVPLVVCTRRKKADNG